MVDNLSGQDMPVLNNQPTDPLIETYETSKKVVQIVSQFLSTLEETEIHTWNVNTISECCDFLVSFDLQAYKELFEEEQRLLDANQRMVAVLVGMHLPAYLNQDWEKIGILQTSILNYLNEVGLSNKVKFSDEIDHWSVSIDEGDHSLFFILKIIIS